MHDHENEDVTNIQGEAVESELEIRVASDIACITQDIDVIRLKRKRDASLPTYIPYSEKGNARDHSYFTAVDSRKSRKTQFVEYNGAYFRKTTSLYILQENFQIPNARLLRVRSAQPSHLFSSSDFVKTSSSIVQMGDLCHFRRVDSKKVFLGRVFPISYFLSPLDFVFTAGDLSIWRNTLEHSVIHL